ncbi:MAG: PspC domain-containing protein [Candidatus Gracilibacteria bacterium]|nr:PspC domain-containing protein [Candidatus Gracilibacteria bacterium]
MNKFEKYKLKLSDKQKDLVNTYLKKIKKFVEKHSIENELYLDIEEMVFEKLSIEKKPTDLKIIRILKEVGEPEIIFSDYVSGLDSKEEKELFYEKLIQSSWIRDNENAIFLGISKTLSEKIGVSVLAIRIIILILTFPVGIGLWLYLLAGILLPVKGIDYTGKSVVGFLKTQLILMIRNGVFNLSKSFLRIFNFLAKNSFQIFKSIFTFFVKNIFPIFRFFIFAFVGIFFSIGLFVLIILGSSYFSNFSIENVDFFMEFPSYFIYSILFGILSLFIFAIASFYYGLNKKVINKYVLISGFTSILISIFLGFSTGFDLLQKYVGKNNYNQTASLEIGNTGSYLIDLSVFDDSFVKIDFGSKNINFVNYTGSALKIEVKNTIYANSEVYVKTISGFSNLNLIQENNNIKLAFDDNKLFSKKVPFAPLDREITLFIPNGIKFSLDGYYYFKNAELDSGYEKYKNLIGTNCINREVYYKAEESRFVCIPNQDEIDGELEDEIDNQDMQDIEEKIEQIDN